jgi:hypothetical protein
MTHDSKTKIIVAGMRVWWSKVFDKDGWRKRPKRDARTVEQAIWDNAIFAAAEFVRRFDCYDETRARAIHALLSSELKAEAESHP